MKKIILLDENSNILNSIEFNTDEFFKPSEKIEEIEKLSYQEFIDVVEYGVDIYKPYNKGNEFIVKNISNLLLSLFNGDSNLVKGRFLSKSFPVLNKIRFQNILKEVYKTGETKYFKAQYYDNNNLMASFKHAFINFKGEIFLFTKTEDSIDSIIQQEEDLFNKSIIGILVIQNKKVVRVNEAFAKNIECTVEEALKMDAMNFEIFENANKSITKVIPEEIESIFSKLINKELPYYNGFIKHPLKDKHIWFKTHAIPTTFNRKPAVQISCIDVTESLENEILALRFKETLDLVQNVSKIAFVYWDTINSIQWTDEIYNILEEEKSNLHSSKDMLKDFILKEDKDHIKKILQKALNEKGDFDTVIRIKTRKGIKHINVYGKYTLNKFGNYTFVGYVQDVSESVSREFTLEKALVEKDFLIKEVNHRVKNNLQIILSLLNLDLRRNSHDLEKAIQSTQNRIKAMAFIHEKTYESADLDHVNLKEYIETETKSLLEFYGASNIETHEDLEDINLDMEIVTPLGLAINEVIINIIKYAFPEGNGGNLSISLKKEKKTVSLIIGDDGVGLPEDVDIYNSPSLGLSIINSLVSQIEGSFKQLNSEKGTVYEIQFEINEELI